MITVIIPTYNRPNCLKKALGSLALQTDNRFNVLVVDDCSTEDVKWIVDAYIESGMAVEYIKTPQNGGAGMARNYGIDYVTERANANKVKGSKKNKKQSQMSKDFIVFLDSDDMLLPNAIATYNSVLHSTEQVQVLATLFMEEHNDQYGNKYYTQPAINNITWVHGKLYSLDLLNDYSLRFPDMPYGEDLAFNSLVYTVVDKPLNSHVQTHLRTMEQNSLTNVSVGKEKSTYGFLEGANWYANEINRRNLIGKAKYTILPNMVSKMYYYSDYLRYRRPQYELAEFLAKDFYQKINLEEFMKEPKFISKFIDEFSNAMIKYIEGEAYTPFKTFDQTMQELGLDVKDYRNLVKVQ